MIVLRELTPLTNPLLYDKNSNLNKAIKYIITNKDTKIVYFYPKYINGTCLSNT